MNRYHRYQNVNSYWYDEVPDHWKKTKNKYVFHQDKKVVGSSWEDYVLLTMGKFGVKPRDMDGGGKFPASFENYQVVTPNQIIFCLFDIDETPRAVGKSSDHGMITSAYDVFSTTTGNDPQFWTYFYQMIDDHKGLRPYYTGLRKVVRSETFMGIEVFSPPIEEQKLIAHYLDKKTEQIDRLIDKTQKKIELLKEQRTAWIDQCINKGSEYNLDGKISHLEGEQDTDLDFKKKKLKYLFKINKGILPQSLKSEKEKDTFPYLSMNVLRGGNPTEFTEINNCVSARKGDIAILWDGSNAGEILKINVTGVLSSTVALLRVSNSDLKQDYAFYLLKSLESLIKFNTIGMGIPHVNGDFLKNLEVNLPPIKVQERITNVLESNLLKLQKSMFHHIDKISLLKEYRQSLVSSVTTGQVLVTEDMI